MSGRGGGTVRIIAGEWRSRRIEVPAGDATRPMLDRVKAAVFSALGSYYGTPGTLPPIVVADVFAGGGTLGLEALSRGASSAVFFEQGSAALGALRRNLTTLGVGPRAVIEAVDVWRTPLDDVLLRDGCSLVLLDPPYRDAGPSGKLVRLLRALTGFAREADQPMLVLHHPAKVRFAATDPELWSVYATRQYGTTGITLLTGVARSSGVPASQHGAGPWDGAQGFDHGPEPLGSPTAQRRGRVYHAAEDQPRDAGPCHPAAGPCHPPIGGSPGGSPSQWRTPHERSEHSGSGRESRCRSAGERLSGAAGGRVCAGLAAGQGTQGL